MSVQQDNRSSQVPAVDFYGEAAAWPVSELVHSEALAERSGLHDWKIRPHRHNDLAQLFLVLEGHGRARLDSVWHAVRSPCLLVVPERVVHEFEWDTPSDGYVLSVQSSMISALTRKMKPLAGAFANAAVIELSASRDLLSELFLEIHAETVAQRVLRDASLESLVRLLGIWLARRSTSESADNTLPTRARRHCARFTALVDEHHKSNWSVAEYASALGITPSHLNAVCRKTVGKSALSVIHERLLLAARRELVYTERNIAGIAHHLGFADPSYFTRFFKRATGMTPGAFRRRSGTFDGGASG